MSMRLEFAPLVEGRPVELQCAEESMVVPRFHKRCNHT